MRRSPSPNSQTANLCCRLPAAVILGVIAVAEASPARADDGGTLFEIPITPQRDANFNRIISTGSALGAAAQSRSIGAIANTISIVQSGSGNTIILNAEQTNSGAVIAADSLNGRLNLE